jgi:hypothetical protein
MKTIIDFFTGIGRKSETIKTDAKNGNIGLFHKHGNDHLTQSQIRYQCPMKCEGEKTYDEPGICPVCKMKLVPVNNAKSHNHHHRCC